MTVDTFAAGVSAGVAPAPPRRIMPLRDAVAGALVVFMVSSFGLGVTYYFSRQAQIESVQQELLQLAAIAAANVDVEAHRQLALTAKDRGPEYMRVVTPLADLQRIATDVLYLFTVMPVDGRLLTGVDTATLFRAPGDTSPRLNLREVYDIEDADLARTIATGRPRVGAETWTEPGRQFLSAYAPFFDASGTVVGVVEVDMWVRSLESRLAGLLRIAWVALASLAIISVGSGAVLFRLRGAAAAAALRDQRTLRDLLEARDAAERSSRAKSAFLAVMSHELRTPLNAIIGYGEMLREEFDDLGDETMKADTGRIVSAGRQLTANVGDILDCSRLDAAQLALAPVAVDLRDLIGSLAELLRPGAIGKGLARSVDVAPCASAVVADPVRLRQVLLNLMGNALKFTARGRITVRVRGAPGRPDHVVVAVHDTGAGIAANVRDRLFQPFSQLETATARGEAGTGLGLVISRRLVEAMGGTLRFKSRDGRGSTFRVSIPRAAAAAESG